MSRAVVFAAGASLLVSGAIEAQEPRTPLDQLLSRGQQIVIHSPHFDEPVPPWGGLSCPPGPLHLYGFETSERDVQSGFRIRAFNFDPGLTRPPVYVSDDRARLAPAEGAMILLTRRWDGTEEVELPHSSTFTALADSTGLATFEVAPGVYGLRVVLLGVREDEAVVRVRDARVDSLHAYLIPGAICEQ